MGCKKVPLKCGGGHLGFRAPCEPCPSCEPPIDWQARAEKAEAERDQARHDAVRARFGPGGWVAIAHAAKDLILTTEGWARDRLGVIGKRHGTEAEAVAAGRALPWWGMKP